VPVFAVLRQKAEKGTDISLYCNVLVSALVLNCFDTAAERLRPQGKGQEVFREGDCLVFGLHGVCQMMGKQEDTADGSEMYVLQPIYDQRSRIFVPVDSEVLCAKMRPVLSKEEAETLIDQMPEEKEIWISNENQRKERYHEIVKRGERRELVQLVKTLYLQQEKMKKAGKRLYRIDEKYFKDAKKILYGELAHVLEMGIDEVEPYILERTRGIA